MKHHITSRTTREAHVLSHVKKYKRWVRARDLHAQQQRAARINTFTHTIDL